MNKNEVPGSTKLEEIKLRNEKLKSIDESIAFYKEQVELSESIKRLKQNPDYIKVYEQAYFKSEGERISNVILEPNTLKRDQLENMLDMMSSIRNVKTFIMYRENDGEVALQHIADLEKMKIDELNPQSDGE